MWSLTQHPTRFHAPLHTAAMPQKIRELRHALSTGGRYLSVSRSNFLFRFHTNCRASGLDFLAQSKTSPKSLRGYNCVVSSRCSSTGRQRVCDLVGAEKRMTMNPSRCGITKCSRRTGISFVSNESGGKKSNVSRVKAFPGRPPTVTSRTADVSSPRRRTNPGLSWRSRYFSGLAKYILPVADVVLGFVQPIWPKRPEVKPLGAMRSRRLITIPVPPRIHGEVRPIIIGSAPAPRSIDRGQHNRFEPLLGGRKPSYVRAVAIQASGKIEDLGFRLPAGSIG